MKVVDSQTGEYVDVPAEQAPELLRSGKYALEAGQRVDVKRHGVVGDVSAEELAQFLSEGGEFASDEEVSQAEAERRYGSAGQQAIGLGEAAFRGVVPGATAIEERLGVDVEGIKGREEALGDTGLALEVGAGVGSMFLPGLGLAKLGKAGQVLRGATAAPRAIARVGLGAEKAVEGAIKGRMGAGALGRAAEAVVPKAAGGALETAIWGAGEALNEEALSGGNYDRLAETLAAHVTPAALIGGTAAGAFGLGGHAIRGSASKLASGWKALKASEIESLASKHFGHDVPKGFGQKVKDWYARVSGVASGAGEENVRKAMSKDIRKMALSGESVRERATRDINDHVQRIAETEDIVRDAAAGKLKGEHVRKHVKTGDPRTMMESRRMGLAFRDEVAGMRTPSGRGLYGSGSTKSIRSLADDADMLLSGMSKRKGKAGAEAETYIAFDNIKRKVGSLKAAAESARPTKADDILHNENYKKKLEQIYRGLQEHLEDANVWGDVASLQAARNAKITRALTDSKRRFDHELTREFRGKFNKRMRGADMERIGKYVNGLKDWKKDQIHGAVREHLSARREMLETIQDQFDLDADAAKKVGDAIDATKAFESTLDETTESIAAENLFRDMIEAEGRSGVGALIGLGGGAMFGGPLGAVAGAAAGAITRPGHTMRQLALLEQMTANVSSRIDGIAKTVVGKLEQVGAKKGGTRLRKTPPAIAHLLDASREERKQRVGDKVAELEKAAADPKVLENMLGDALGDVPTIAPRTANAMYISTAKVLANLLDNAPKKRNAGPFGWNKPSISDSDAEQFAFYAAGAEAPLEALEEQIEADALNSHTVRAVKENHPHLFDQMRTTIIGELSQMEEPPDYQRLLMLGRHFEIQTTASDAPQYRSGVQADYAATASAPPDSPAPSLNAEGVADFGSDTPTEAQRLAAGE